MAYNGRKPSAAMSLSKVIGANICSRNIECDIIVLVWNRGQSGPDARKKIAKTAFETLAYKEWCEDGMICQKMSI